EATSNAVRGGVAQYEPKSLRTYTPSQAVLARSAGVFHWTPEGRRLYDFSSGVLVVNLGHNPVAWMQRFMKYMEWSTAPLGHGQEVSPQRGGGGFFPALPMTAYNAVTSIEIEATRRLLSVLQDRHGGNRL